MPTPVLILVGVLALALVAWWFLVRSDTPPAPDLAKAAETAAAAQVSDTTMQATTTAVPATTGVPVVDPSGRWAVDPAIGSFRDFTSTWVGYRIDEELGKGIGATTAVGRTPLVTGTVEVSDGIVVSAEVTADLRGLQSDRAYRDGKVFEVLHVDRHPEAVFVLAAPVPLTAGATEMSIAVPGVLTVNGVSVVVEAALEVTLVGDILTVVGTLPVVLADHDVVAPSASIVVSVADRGVVEFQLFLTRAVGGTG